MLKRRREDGTCVPGMTFLRIEFQDGKRRAASQSYHGSGRPHSHQLDFVGKQRRAEDLRALKLDECVSASLDQQPATVTAFATASQTDQQAKTPWPIYSGPNNFDPTAEEYHFHHSEADHQRGVRGYFPDVMEVTKCHQDVQVESHGQQNYAAYTAKYAPKFSDSFHQELLNDDADGNSIAASVLSRYHPCVPEMVLQLCGSIFRPWYISTESRGRRSFVAPALAAEIYPKEVLAYQQSAWRSDQMSLLEFLRKSNDAGEIAGWLKDKWQAAGRPLALEEFANRYQMQGEKVVACVMGSRLKDKFYGQWLLLNIPFRDPYELWHEDIVSRVPDMDKCLALCLFSAHSTARAMWQDNAAIDEDMMVEGATHLHRRMVLDHINSQRSLLQKYLTGEVSVPTLKTTSAEAVAKTCQLPIQRSQLNNIASGRKTVEGRIHKGIPACIQVGDRIRFQHVVKQVSHVAYYASFWDMLEDVGFENAMPDAHSIEEALEVYHHFPRYEDLAKEHGVCAFWLEEPVATNAERQQWNPEQLRWKALMLEDLERALAAHEAATEGDLDEAREAAYSHNKIRALEGPPGTGKTSIAVRNTGELVAYHRSLARQRHTTAAKGSVADSGPGGCGLWPIGGCKCPLATHAIGAKVARKQNSAFELL